MTGLTAGHRRLLRGAAVAVALASALVALPAATAATAAPVPAVVDDGPSGNLPMTTTVRPDGTVLKEVPADVLQKLTAAAANPGCGRVCDGENPQTYMITPPGGPSNWYTCAADAITAKQALMPGGSSSGVELRYSPRCRTAWSRQLRLTNNYNFWLHVNSYYLSGTLRTSAYEGRLVPYTAMVDDAGLKARACVVYIQNNEEELLCTSKY